MVQGENGESRAIVNYYHDHISRSTRYCPTTIPVPGTVRASSMMVQVRNCKNKITNTVPSTVPVLTCTKTHRSRDRDRDTHGSVRIEIEEQIPMFADNNPTPHNCIGKFYLFYQDRSMRTLVILSAWPTQ